MSKIEIQESIALNDSCQVQYWAKGHHAYSAFIEAIRLHVKDMEREKIPYWVLTQAPVKNIYQRTVPLNDHEIGDCQYVMSETKGSGAYPVTVMDFWFPWD